MHWILWRYYKAGNSFRSSFKPIKRRRIILSVFTFQKKEEITSQWIRTLPTSWWSSRRSRCFRILEESQWFSNIAEYCPEILVYHWFISSFITHNSIANLICSKLRSRLNSDRPNNCYLLQSTTKMTSSTFLSVQDAIDWVEDFMIDSTE